MSAPPSAAPPVRPDLCVIGAGAAGLTVAAGAARLGASVVLVERGAMGGDCLNAGCVPSKALLAAARAARQVGDADRFGVRTEAPRIDFAAVMAHVHETIAALAPHDSQARFEGLGVTVLRDTARFLDAHTIAVGRHRLRPRRVVIATGSRPRVPPIEGLADGPLLTNESLFHLSERPDALVILGGGPIGCEMAQAFRRLGSAVTLVEADRLLGRDDPDLTAVVRDALRRDGVEVREGWRATRVTHANDGTVRVALTDRAEHRAEVVGSHLLVALGRAPVTDDLDLAAAGIAETPDGITVDDSLRTGNRRVYAIGDVAGGPQFTHLAAHQGGLMIRRLLFRLPARASAAVVPHVTYTDPELASVGLTEAEARARHGDGVRVLRWPFSDNDRARAERDDAGLVKVITTRRGRILGAGIAGSGAGDLLAPWTLALHKGLGVGALATVIAPYPTRGEASKRAAGAFYEPTLFSTRSRLLTRLLSRLG